MPITINGSGTVTGISAGGLPDGVITTDDIAANAVTQAKRSEQLTLDTAKASTSGTFVDFTGIPSWVKRVTVMFNGVSTNGTSNLLVQTGSGSFDTSGYIGAGSQLNASSLVTSNSTAGYLIQSGSAANTISGALRITLLGSNTWVAEGSVGLSNTTTTCTVTGSRSTSGTLDRIRITTVNGTDTFDAGTINILYE